MHWTAPDQYGHQSGWGGAVFSNQVMMLDAQLGRVMDTLKAVTRSGGLAPGAAIPGHEVAGMPGTSPRFGNPEHAGVVASFIGCVPAAAPEFVLLVVVDLPADDGTGAEIAAPAFSRIAGGVMRVRADPVLRDARRCCGSDR